MERETGFEPATSTLARSHSTTELFPLSKNGSFLLYNVDLVKGIVENFIEGKKQPQRIDGQWNMCWLQAGADFWARLW